jgi:PAS domain S-box-containing protein
MFKTNIDRTEGHYFFEFQNGLWDLPELKTKLNDIIQKEKSFENCEITKFFPGIGEKILLFNAIRMRQEDDKNTRALLVIQDITERAQAQRDLKEREERFRLLLQNAFDIMTIYSANGDILYQSEALERSLGYPVKETLNKNIYELSILHPDDMELNKNMMNEALINPGKNIKGQLRLQHKNGSYKIMDVIFRNLLNNKSIEGIIGNYQEVTNNL